MATPPLIEHHETLLEGTGLRMHYAQIKGPGPTIIFVHGFPELWISWKELMITCNKHGYNVVAPDMRGYGDTEAPAAAGAYHMKYLIADLLSLQDHLKQPQTVFIGHDWGGSIVNTLIFHHPDRCIAASSLNTPLDNWRNKVGKGKKITGPLEYLSSRPVEEAGLIDYQVYFQEPGVAEIELERDVERTMNAFFRSQINPDKRERYKNVVIGMRVANVRKTGILSTAPLEIKRDPVWPNSELDYYVRQFEKTGFRGPINYYRNIDANLRWNEKCGVTQDSVVHMPFLMVTAEYDMVLPPSATKGMERRLPNLTRAHVRCGHWTQREAKEELDDIVINWLTTAVRDAKKSKL